VAKGGYERHRIKQKRLAERHARKKAQRNKLILQWSIGAAVLVGVGLILLFTLTGGKAKPVAKASTTPSPTASPSPIPGCSLPNGKSPSGKQFKKAPAMTIDTSKTYTVKLTTTCGPITWKLDAKNAPATTNNIVFLVKQHFYDNTIFHRVQNVPGSFAIVQGGDPTGTGSGSPGYSYKGEKPKSGSKYVRGTLAMANSGSLDTNGSQFFMVVQNWPDLPLNYTIFGKVIETDSFATLDRMITATGSDLGNGLGISPAPQIQILKATVTVS
jgi:peptidyl-prolyl cis-trans isomerase B (cyclophilin B)